MKILITGVAGLIGSNFADWVCKNIDCDVIGIDDLSGGYKENINSKVKFEPRDLSKDDISGLFKGVDRVYHFAAYAAEGLSPFIRKFNYQNNLIGTANVINECINHNVRRLVFTSSMAVYGKQEFPFKETQTPNPIDPYGVAKYACEMDIKIANEQHGLDYCIIRPHNVFGEKQNIWDKYRNVLGIWIYQYLNNQPLTVFGDGEQVRAFTYIKNILKPLWFASYSNNSKNEVINLGGIKPLSINSTLQLMCELLSYDKIEYLQPRHEVKYAYATYGKSVDLLGYKESYSIEDGLKNMIEWAIQQKNRKRFKWDQYEINKKLYEFWK